MAHPLDVFEPEKYDPEKQTLTLKCCTAVLPDKDTVFGEVSAIKRILQDAGDLFWKINFANSGQLDVAIEATHEDAASKPEFEIEIGGQKVSAPIAASLTPLGSVTLGQPGNHPVAMRVRGEFTGLFVSVQLSGAAAVGAVQERVPFEIRTVSLYLKDDDAEYDMIYVAVTPKVSSMGTSFVVLALENGAQLAVNDVSWNGEKTVTFGGEDYPCPWALGQTYHFLVRAVPDPDGKSVGVSAYSCSGSQWKLIGTVQVESVKLLTKAASFISQRYGVQRGYYPREAYFGPFWARVPGGNFEHLTTADFEAAPSFDRLPDNIDAAVVESAFVLRTGGDTKMTLTSSPTTLSATKLSQLPELLIDVESKLA